MKTILTFLTALLLFCGFSTNNLYANPLDNTTVSSISGTFDKYCPMQYDGRTVDIRVIWEMRDGKIVNVLGGASGKGLFSTRDICYFNTDLVFLTSYINDMKNKKKIEITGYVNITTGYAKFELIDRGSGIWPWTNE